VRVGTYYALHVRVQMVSGAGFGGVAINPLWNCALGGEAYGGACLEPHRSVGVALADSFLIRSPGRTGPPRALWGGDFWQQGIHRAASSLGPARFSTIH
jgi:hypothetical protein